jgi:hypothetical protein
MADPLPSREPARCTVLLLDDGPYPLLVWRRLLADEFDVLTAGSAREARALMRRRRIDIVLARQRQAGMPGVELLGWALANHPRTQRLLWGLIEDLAAGQPRPAASDFGAWAEKTHQAHHTHRRRKRGAFRQGRRARAIEAGEPEGRFPGPRNPADWARRPRRQHGGRKPAGPVLTPGGPIVSRACNDPRSVLLGPLRPLGRPPLSGAGGTDRRRAAPMRENALADVAVPERVCQAEAASLWVAP